MEEKVFTQSGEEAEKGAFHRENPPPHQTVRKLLASRRPWKNDLHSFDMARFLWRRGVREPFFRSSKTPFRSFRTACYVGGYEDGFIDACAVIEIPENRARIVCLSGQRVA